MAARQHHPRAHAAGAAGVGYRARPHPCALAACETALQQFARTEACLWLLASTIYERTLLARRV